MIEVTAAVAVAALILAAVYGVVTTTMTSQRRAEEVLGVYKEGGAILTLVCEDLRCAVYNEKTENFAVTDEMEFPGFSFVTVGWDPETGGNVLGEVGYELERRGDHIRLFRRFARIEGNIAKGGTYTLVSDDIASWKVEYFDGEEWREEWNEGKSLPLSVAVEITLEAAQREPVCFRRQVALPASNLAEAVVIPEAPEGA